MKIVAIIILVILTTWFQVTDIITEKKTPILAINNNQIHWNNKSNKVHVKYRWEIDLWSKYFIWWVTYDTKIYQIYYDPKQWYMIVSIEWTYYHYCKIPRNVWYNFYNSNDKYNHYQSFIYKRFDCRLWGIWEYSWSLIIDFDSIFLNKSSKSNYWSVDEEDKERWRQEDDYAARQEQDQQNMEE